LFVSTLKVIDTSNTALLKLLFQQATGLYQETMEAFTGIGVILPYTVVDQAWQLKRISQANGDINRGIVFRSERLLKPAKNIIGSPSDVSTIEPAGTVFQGDWKRFE